MVIVVSEIRHSENNINITQFVNLKNKKRIVCVKEQSIFV